MTKIRDVLKTTIADVFPCDHILDDSFLRDSLKETDLKMSYRAYTPVAVCLKSDCFTEDGFALLFTLDDGEFGWVHVAHERFLKWLEELDELPSDDSWWSWEFIRNYYWKGHIADVQKKQ